ncbi:MAG: ferritin-like domain-containing protein [Myxococcota bacterium]
MTSPDAFVAQLRALVDRRLAELGETEALTFESKGSLEIPVLLRLALKNELEATEVAGRWLAGVSDSLPLAAELKLLLARQAGDEAKHYGLIAARLRELDVDVTGWDPFRENPRSPLYSFLLPLTDPVEQMAAGPFAREALACVKNQQFIALCRKRGDVHTAALYERRIQPDESHHHELGAGMLRRLCVDEASQARALAAVEKTLALADELAEKARQKGICRAPGC